MNNVPQLVTIGIVTRNRLQFLKESVASALNQECASPYEIVVADDASDDPSVRVFLESFENSNLHTVFRDKQGGEAASRNSILERMTGDFVMWLDDDDCLEPAALGSQLAALERDPDADVIYANLIRTDESLCKLRDYVYREIPSELRPYVLLFYSPFPNGGSLIRKTLFSRCGKYDETMKIAPDYEFWTRAVRANASFCHNNDSIYLYRGHGSNAALDNEDALFYEMNCRVIERVLERFSLEEIFPMYPWAVEKEKAFAMAMMNVAVAYLRYKNFEKALEAVRKGKERSRITDLFALEAMICRASGDNDGAVSRFEEVALAQNQALLNACRMAGLR